MEILKNSGFDVEAHDVHTKDGYILEVYQIFKKENNASTRNFPVLIQHGVLGSSADWVIGGPEKSLRE